MDVKIDYELLVQICKEKNRVFYPHRHITGSDENIILHDAFIHEDFIISSYKNISWPNFVLPLDVYLPRLREKITKERESKLNKLLKI
jgi:hypothetical protein